MDVLTVKQRRFVAAYMGEAEGNATQACRIAGYKGDAAAWGVQGHRNLRLPKVQAAIEKYLEHDPLLMGRDDLQAFWSAIVMDEEAPLALRIEASDKLAKTHAMFVAKTEITGQLTLADLARKARDE